MIGLRINIFQDYPSCLRLRDRQAVMDKYAKDGSIVGQTMEYVEIECR